jgi:NADPH-dependent 7-cyano-7-deazaguanine reductase QueF
VCLVVDVSSTTDDVPKRIVCRAFETVCLVVRSTTDDVDERIVSRAFETVCLVVCKVSTTDDGPINGLLVVRLKRCVWLYVR